MLKGADVGGSGGFFAVARIRRLDDGSLEAPVSTPGTDGNDSSREETTSRGNDRAYPTQPAVIADGDYVRTVRTRATVELTTLHGPLDLVLPGSVGEDEVGGTPPSLSSPGSSLVDDPLRQLEAKPSVPSCHSWFPLTAAAVRWCLTAVAHQPSVRGPYKSTYVRQWLRTLV
jgi:hypothetical protein